MARSPKDDMLEPYAKYEIFKRAFDRVNECLNSGDYLTGSVLAFSILEDRTRAAVAVCFDAIDEPLGREPLNNVPYSRLVARLKRVKAIDAKLEADLKAACDLRNELVHQMMWKLEVFTPEYIIEVKRLIEAVNSSRRKFLKLHKKGSAD
jgi:uncharacterized protein YutE (UPF0331/DUF86 family)